MKETHCNHECVCHWHVEGKVPVGNNQVCKQPDCQYDSRKHNPDPKFTSTDILLLANDEWKRREERKHNHENIPWCAGFINGFLTDKKWARNWIDKIQTDAEEKISSNEEP